VASAVAELRGSTSCAAGHGGLQPRGRAGSLLLPLPLWAVGPSQGEGAKRPRGSVLGGVRGEARGCSPAPGPTAARAGAACPPQGLWLTPSCWGSGVGCSSARARGLDAVGMPRAHRAHRQDQVSHKMQQQPKPSLKALPEEEMVVLLPLPHPATAWSADGSLRPGHSSGQPWTQRWWAALDTAVVGSPGCSGGQPWTQQWWAALDTAVVGSPGRSGGGQPWTQRWWAALDTAVVGSPGRSGGGQLWTQRWWAALDAAVVGSPGHSGGGQPWTQWWWAALDAAVVGSSGRSGGGQPWKQQWAALGGDPGPGECPHCTPAPRMLLL